MMFTISINTFTLEINGLASLYLCVPGVFETFLNSADAGDCSFCWLTDFTKA